MEFQVGESHAGYEILEVVKRSKNGVEYRVKNTLVERIEMLRCLPEGAQSDPERSARFLREMRVHAGLVHPNIVMLFSALELDGHVVITTEVVEGQTLAERLGGGSLSWQEAVAITRQVLCALEYAHGHKVVHRSISPENLLITANGVVKLANFALAKAADSPQLTQVGVAIGDVKYISPEQIKGLGDVDARSDLYSLGMVLYEMLCGHPAFHMASSFEVMAAQVNETPVAPHVVNAAVPEKLDAVLLRALAKDPASRFQNADEFDAALGKVAAEVREESAGFAEETGPEMVQAAEAVTAGPEPVVAEHGMVAVDTALAGATTSEIAALAEAVAEMAEPAVVEQGIAEPVAEVAMPVEAAAEVVEPVVVEQAIAEPVAEVAMPVEAAEVVEPVVVEQAIAEPVAEVAMPAEAVAEVVEPVVVEQAIAEPVAEVAMPVEAVAEVVKAVAAEQTIEETVAEVALPVEDVAEVVAPVVVEEAIEEPMAEVAMPVEAVPEVVEPVAAEQAIEETVAEIAMPVEAVVEVVEPVAADEIAEASPEPVETVPQLAALAAAVAGPEVPVPVVDQPVVTVKVLPELAAQMEASEPAPVLSFYSASEAPDLAERHVAAPPSVPAPVLFGAADAGALSRTQLMIGGVAGAFLGVLLVTVWLLVK